LIRDRLITISASFSLTAFILGLSGSALALTEKEQWLKENETSLRILPQDPPELLRHGGPDGGGYYYIDSDDEALNAPVYEWIDISGDGMPLDLEDDQNRGPISLGFDVEFYGNTFDSIYICSNGWLSFTDTVTAYINQAIPAGARPNNLLAVFWHDLNPENGGQVYYRRDTDPDGRLRFIVSYDSISYYQNLGSLYFQVIILETGDIYYQYATMDDGGHGNNLSTVGIENGIGTIGTQYLYNQDGIHNDMAVYFGLIPPIYAEHDVSPISFLSPTANIVAVGDTIDPVVRFQNFGANTESFTVRLTVNHGGEMYNETNGIVNLPSGRIVDVAFPFFTPEQEGVYLLAATSELVGDGIPANDTLRKEFTAFANVYIEFFESGNGGFVGDNDWQWGVPTSGPNAAHSGAKLWATILGGNYTNGPLLSTLISPPLGLNDNASLTLWHWYNTESGFDGGNVKISTDDGATWQIIYPVDGYDGLLSTDYQNPIGGEQAFYGMSNGWLLETFNLSDFAGSSAQIKFDFGSDTSINYSGWYIDDFIVYGGGGTEPGWVSGVVTSLDTGLPIQGAAVNAGTANDQTDENGGYFLELFPGVYSVTATAQYHSPITVDGVEVTTGDTTGVDFALPAPSIQIDTTPIETSLSPGQTVEFARNLANVGSGDLEFDVAISMGDRRIRIKPDPKIKINDEISYRSIKELSSTQTDYSPACGSGDPPTTLDFGEEVFVFDPQTPANDVACLGVEFDGTYFWVTGRYSAPGGDDVHKLHKFDRNGNYLESFDQGTFSIWGWRDLAWDGAYLYASDENELAIIDPATGQKIGQLPMPTGITPPLRALAYDPQTDHFWAANFRSNIIEFDRNGQTLAAYANGYAAYGMAWDGISDDGPWLWVFSQDGIPQLQVSQFDPRTGTYTGIVFYAIDHGGENDDVAGGACFTTEWDPTLGILFCLVQGTVDGLSADRVQGYEITSYSQWISVNPMSGVLAPSENVNLTITLDFTGDDIVPDSIYQAQVIINNNSPITPTIPVTVDVRSGIDDKVSDLPERFALYQNYPNPFNPSTSIKFALPEQSDVTIEIFNILGQRVAIVSEGLMPAGYHSASWDGSKVSSGIYYYKISAGGFIEVKKMTLLK